MLATEVSHEIQQLVALGKTFSASSQKALSIGNGACLCSDLLLDQILKPHQHNSTSAVNFQSVRLWLNLRSCSDLCMGTQSKAGSGHRGASHEAHGAGCLLFPCTLAAEPACAYRHCSFGLSIKFYPSRLSVPLYMILCVKYSSVACAYENKRQLELSHGPLHAH